MRLSEQIMEHGKTMPEGSVLSPKEFLHIGGRDEVDRALYRLVKAGRLLRVARCTYVMPVVGRFGSHAPATQKVVESIAAYYGEVVVPHGAAAADALGLTQQVPIREVYVTTGRTRKLQVGSSVVMVRRAPRWMFLLGSRPAGAAIRALSWLGREHAQDSVRKLRSTLALSEWCALTSQRAWLPGWMAEAIAREDAGG